MHMKALYLQTEKMRRNSKILGYNKPMLWLQWFSFWMLKKH